jgi:hypothetical protein
VVANGELAGGDGGDCGVLCVGEADCGGVVERN